MLGLNETIATSKGGRLIWLHQRTQLSAEAEKAETKVKAAEEAAGAAAKAAVKPPEGTQEA